MYCILIKGNHRYKIYTNQIFTFEDEALDYVKRSKFKKNVEWKVEEFDNKYFKINLLYHSNQFKSFFKFKKKKNNFI